MIGRYITSAIIALAADVLAFLLAPIAALFVTHKNGREELWALWKWIYTHDAPIDSGHVDGYWETAPTRLGRYWSRVKWIWRNPAYTVSHWLGYDQRGMSLTKNRDEMSLRNTGLKNISYYTSINGKGKKGFMYFAQLPYPFIKGKTLELYLGYKLTRRDPDKRCMLAIRVKPFKYI